MSFKQKIWSVKISAPIALADAVGDMLAKDSLAVSTLAPPRDKMAMIEALYTDRPDPAALTSSLAILAALHKIKMPAIIIREMPKLDWLKKVAEDFPPLHIARWTIHGALHRAKVPNRRYALQIDATNAFGTGEHPTTKGCLILLDKRLKTGKLKRTIRILDMGCGSGILAMAAVQGSNGRAVAVDLDPDSVTIARENAGVNGLRRAMCIGKSRGYRSRLVSKGARYDVIMANIFAVPVSHMAKDLKRHLNPGGTIILAGLLTQQANRVLAAHRLQKLYLKRRIEIGEWSILALQDRPRA